MSPTLKFVFPGVLVLTVVILCAKPLGGYIADVMEGRRHFGKRIGVHFERFLYQTCGIDVDEEMSWSRYAICLLSFNFLGALALYALQRLQQWLPLNPQHFTGVSADSAFNTATAFATNTDWQGYSGESTMGYFVQCAGLTVQNFLSAATGLVVAIALIRGFTRRSSKTIGNVWVDITRCTVYVLLPLSSILALVLISQGVIQNVDLYKDATTIEKLTFDNTKNDADGNPLKDDKGKALCLSGTQRNLKYWDGLATLSEVQRDVERLRLQAPDLVVWRKSPSEDDRWWAATYDEAHKPGGERNPILVASDPPLTRSGASFAQPQEIDFAAGAANDPYGFKPTDLVVGQDGSLFVSDWADGQRPKRGRGRV